MSPLDVLRILHASGATVVLRPDDTIPWGDGQQRVPVVPWLCQHCGALAILHLPTGQLTATTDAEWEPVRQKNPALWQAILRARAAIRPQEDDA